MRSGRGRALGGLSIALGLLIAALALGMAGRVHPAGAATTAPFRSISAPVRNTFGRDMFGISADGSIQNESARTLARDLANDQATGAKWLRIGINWAQIQPRQRGKLQWSRIDAVVKGAEARGMTVLGDIAYTPSWAGEFRHCRTSYCAPNPVDFANFAKVAVAHYSELGVNAYEIWNEENTTDWWQPDPSPAAYATLLKDTYPLIKQAEPSSTVVTGGTSPSYTADGDYSPVDFLTALYKDGAKGSFDAVGSHPYAWPAYPGQDFSWSPWWQTYGARDSMRNVMIANGDGNKLIWGTEFGAATYGPKGSYVSTTAQAKMIYSGFKLWSTYRWAGPLIVFEGRDGSKLNRSAGKLEFLGLEYHNFVKKPAFGAYQRAVRTF